MTNQTIVKDLQSHSVLTYLVNLVLLFEEFHRYYANIHSKGAQGRSQEDYELFPGDFCFSLLVKSYYTSNNILPSIRLLCLDHQKPHFPSCLQDHISADQDAQTLI